MHNRFTLGLLMCLAVPLAESAPKPKGDDKSALYFPTTVGAKRVMEGDTGGRSGERTEVVTKVEAKDGTYRVTVEGQPETPVSSYVLEASEKGLFRVAIAGKDLREPLALLRLPAKPGDTWKVERTNSTYSVGKEEEVEVPAGKFKAVPLTWENERGQKGTTWYAVGVGPVKVVRSSSKNEQTEVLKSFIAGDKK